MSIVVIPPLTASFGAVACVRTLSEFFRRRSRPLPCRLPSDSVSPLNGSALEPLFDPAELRGFPAGTSLLLVTPGWIPDAGAAGATVLLLTTPFAGDVAAAARRRDRWRAAGAAGSRIRFALLHDGFPGGLSCRAVEELLEERVFSVPYDPRLMAACENDGVSFYDRAPAGHRVIRAVESLATELMTLVEQGDGAQGNALDPASFAARIASSLWRRWTGLADPGAGGVSLEHEVDREIDRCAAASGTLDASGRAEVRRRVLAHLTGLGPLESLLEDESVNDILVNGTGPVYVERNGALTPAGVRFDSDEQLQTVIDRVVGRAGRRVDLSSPLCDVRWKDGSRVNVALPPVALAGASLTIRRFRKGFESLEAFVAAGTLTAGQAERLRSAVRDRFNIVVAGNTGAGKTTLLNVLAGLVSDRERIVTLEDAAELRIEGPQVVRLETRPRNTEGTGEITISDLLVNALRMRPDRIVVGECRGAEAVPMLQAMNTGHDGSLTTLHSNSATDALERLEAMVLLGAPQWPVEVVRRQIAAAVDLIVYLKRDGARRQLTEMGRVSTAEGILSIEPVDRP